MTLVAGHEPPEVLQPREQAFDLPPATVAPELAPVLLAVAPRAAVGRDELDAARGQLGVELVAVVALVADQSRDLAPEEAGLERGVDQRGLGGIRTCDSNGERKTSTVCDCHDLGAFPLAGESDSGAPFFAPAKVASMKASLKSYPPAAASSRARWWRIRASAPPRAQSWKRR